MILISASSRRVFKNMSLSYDDTKGALDNRRNFLSSLGIDYRDLVCAKQIHSGCVRYVTEEDKGRGALSYSSSIADTDALVTDKINLPLAVFTADCLPIFLYDPATPAVGLVHAGWRSTKENITAQAVKLMQKKFNTVALRLYVGFGPGIRNCCYEVGEDFKESFAPELIRRDNRYYLDLVQVNKKQILQLGVCEKNIFDSQICTYCGKDEFFSYRKEGNACGRMMSVIMLK